MTKNGWTKKSILKKKNKKTDCLRKDQKDAGERKKKKKTMSTRL